LVLIAHRLGGTWAAFLLIWGFPYPVYGIRNDIFLIYLEAGRRALQKIRGREDEYPGCPVRLFFPAPGCEWPLKKGTVYGGALHCKELHIMATIKSNVILITNTDDQGENRYSFSAYEFDNGAIMVPGETTADWFFSSRNEYEPNGLDINEIIEDSQFNRTRDWSSEELIESIAKSVSEFGKEAIPANVFDLVA
jgi:hypothetical protein